MSPSAWPDSGSRRFEYEKRCGMPVRRSSRRTRTSVRRTMRTAAAKKGLAVSAELHRAVGVEMQGIVVALA